MAIEHEGKELPARLGLRPLARELGIAHTTLLAQEKQGLFARGEDKKFDVAEVLEYRQTIPEDVLSRGDRAKELAGMTPEERDEAIPQKGGATPAITVSKARKEHWMAEQAQIKAETAKGLLIDRDVVESTLEQIGSTTVTSMRNLVPKLRPYMSDDGREILQREIDATLREIATSLEACVDA